jgi:hypothetical protein
MEKNLDAGVILRAYFFHFVVKSKILILPETKLRVNELPQATLTYSVNRTERVKRNCPYQFQVSLFGFSIYPSNWTILKQNVNELQHQLFELFRNRAILNYWLVMKLSESRQRMLEVNNFCI